MGKRFSYDPNDFVGKGHTGLANLGNTCFMNSTIQCISHSYEFTQLLKNKKESTYNNNKEALILSEWNKLRDLMWSENCTISPGGFLGAVHKLAKHKKKQIFTGFAQNDLPEFLLFLLDCFHEGLKREVTMKVNGNAENAKDELAVKCYGMMKNMYEKEYSEIVSLFYGIHVSQILDVSGVALSSSPEPFFMLNLPIPEKRATCSIEDCFDLYTETERLDGDNQWYNEKTDEKQDVDKKISFFSLPELLVVDFKRFTHRLRKNNMLISFPLEGLDLSKYVVGYDRLSYKYDLYGVCNHSGSTMGGHYTAFVKSADGSWRHYNDRSVQQIPKEKIVSPKAYCLFYRKKK